MKKQLMRLTVLLTALPFLSGCYPTQEMEDRSFVYYGKPIYADHINDEYQGKPTHGGNSWQEFWKDRLYYLHRNRSPRVSSELKAFIVEERRRKGLPEIDLPRSTPTPYHSIEQ